jgi:hypothetical protein
VRRHKWFIPNKPHAQPGCNIAHPAAPRVRKASRPHAAHVSHQLVNEELSWAPGRAAKARPAVQAAEGAHLLLQQAKPLHIAGVEILLDPARGAAFRDDDYAALEVPLEDDLRRGPAVLLGALGYNRLCDGDGLALFPEAGLAEGVVRDEFDAVGLAVGEERLLLEVGMALYLVAVGRDLGHSEDPVD